MKKNKKIVRFDEKFHGLKNEKYESLSLYLAEPAFGTKLYNPRSMKGLALGLKVNGLAEKVQNVFIIGGVIPHLPPFTSKGKGLTDQQNILGMIDKDPEEENTFGQELLKEKIKTPYQKYYYDKYIENSKKRKINSLDDLFKYAGQQLHILESVLPKDVPIRIQAGEGDHQNIQDIRIAKIKGAVDEREEQLGKLYNQFAIEMRINQNKLMEAHINNYTFSKVKENDALKPNGDKRKDYYEKLKKELKPNIFRIINQYHKDFEKNKKEELAEEVIRRIKWAYENKKQEEYSKKVEYEFKTFKKIKKNIQDKLKSIDDSLDWNAILMNPRRKSISRFINQIDITPAEAEMYFGIAKEEYAKNYVKMNLDNPLFFHVTGRKEVDTSKLMVFDEETGKKREVELLEEEIIQNGKKFLLVHNIKEINSNAVSARGIKLAKELSNKYNILLNKLKGEGENPDVILTAHGGGGFRVMPWFKKTEKDEEGIFVSGQEISYLINLPTFQSMSNLEKAVAHNISTNDTKRFENGPWASAAIMHAEKKIGVNNFKIWENETLIKWGKISEAIDVYRKELKEEKDSKKRKILEGLIRKEETKVKISKLIKIEAKGDIHQGHASPLYRYSGDQLLEASHIYQMINGVPAIAIWDEVIHGIQPNYGAAGDYRADIPPKFKKKIELIESSSKLSWKQKFNLLAKSSLTNLRAIPVFNSSKQLEYHDYTFVDYGLKILEAGGILAYASGNHNQKSRVYSDEATELTLAYARKYRESKKVIAIDGLANDVGVGFIPNIREIIPNANNPSIFVSHKFKERLDEIYGIMSQLQGGNNDADIVFAGDRHQTGLGYADGHLILLHPGYQAQNKFVQSATSKPAGVRGFQNAYYDPEHKGIYETDFVLNNTLEKIIQRYNIR